MQQGSLKPDGYIPRVYDRLLADFLDIFGAVEVAGTMWCGKTWTSLSFSESVTRVGSPNIKRSVEADPQIALLGEKPHVIDEWQDVPELWDAVRNSIDAGDPAGSYILTGSSSPNKDRVGHSGAGRIAKLRMRTMSLAETGESTGVISLSGLFEGSFQECLVQQRLEPLSQIICRGGWPALIGADSNRTTRYLDSYFDAVFDISISKKGLSGNEARLVARSLARNLGTATKLETIGKDAFGSDIKSDSSAMRASKYIAALESLYMLELIPGWDAPIRSKSRLRTKPKRYFSDVSLAANLLRINPERLLFDGQLFGIMFESLAMHDLLVYSSVLPEVSETPLYYYRDSDGLEVDAIIELRDGRWAAFEIKLGENKVSEAITSLKHLKKKIGNNPAARNKDPEFMAVIVGAGEFARYDSDADVFIIPLTALGV